MAGITISFDSHYTKKNGEAALYAVTKIDGRKIKFHTQVCVNPSQYDPEKGQILSSHPDHDDLNLLIQTTKSRINEIMVRYRLQYEKLTPELLKSEFENASVRIDFHLFMKDAIRERKGELNESTLKQHRAISNKLKAFSPELKFTQLDSEFLVQFNRWMKTNQHSGQNTRHNAFKILKIYLNIAVRKKIISHNPLTDKMPEKRAKTSREFLTEKEVQDLVSIYNKGILQDNQQKILRHFLFMCFTGLRISDLRSVEMDQVINGTLIYSAIKTRNSKREIIKVPLSRTAKRLIRDESPYRLYGKIFDTYSEQRMRIKIKEIVKLVGVERNISLHTARHTFATMFLRNSKNLAVLQKLLGHSQIEQTMIYTHVLTEDIENEMEKAFRSFS
ncbi:MAG: site-specific integrase [Bacteroidota bacterium]